jgi:hypothetical protein
MAALSRTLAIATLAFALPVQAHVGDAEIVLYRVSGVYDSGGADNTGVATTFFCTNVSGVPETIRFVVRSAGGSLVVNVAFTINHLQTLTVSTHFTVRFGEDASLATGGVNGGTAAIAATSQHMTCSAMIVDAAAAVPQGIALHLLRYNPIPGTEE